MNFDFCCCPGLLRIKSQRENERDESAEFSWRANLVVSSGSDSSWLTLYTSSELLTLPLVKFHHLPFSLRTFRLESRVSCKKIDTSTFKSMVRIEAKRHWTNLLSNLQRRAHVNCKEWLLEEKKEKKKMKHSSTWSIGLKFQSLLSLSPKLSLALTLTPFAMSHTAQHKRQCQENMAHKLYWQSEKFSPRKPQQSRLFDLAFHPRLSASVARFPHECQAET